MFKSLFSDSSARYRHTVAPETLPGVKKQSFVLPFGGGDIWFEHLDGMYQYTDLVLAKLEKDSHTFLLPSKPSHIGFVLDETCVTDAVVEEIVRLLCDTQKTFMRVCFIGTDRSMQKRFCAALRNRSRFAFAFINDFEKAKEWLISE